MTPLEIVNEGQWEHALFTTYALSLSFFETQLLKEGLAKNGCRDIQIVADVDGYAMSLSERQSQRVGNEYRLLPTALQNGVFHPKVSYLAGKEEDILLVGSGNLTFGGYGRNVECLEVIRKSEEPRLFSDLADMLDALALRDDLWLPDRSWVDFWRTRSASGLPSDQPEFPDSPRLLHCVERPIGEQISEQIKALGPVRELRVLSPFYDPDAKGILAFTELLQCSRLVIGLLEGREERTTFPFSNYRQTNVEVCAATVTAPEKGSLHAKWFVVVLETGEEIAITGSVNATRKSLMTSDNIEAAILRYRPDNEGADLGWEETTRPERYESRDYKAAGLGSRVFVHGVMQADGQVEGEITAKEDIEGDWKVVISRADGFSCEQTAPVNQQGHFRIAPDQADVFAVSSAVQIQVSRGDRSGSGWVQVESLLQASRRGYLSPSVMMRLMGSDAELDDDAELLRYLAISANKHLPAFAKRVITKSQESDSEGEGKDSPRDYRIAADSLGTFSTGLDSNFTQGSDVSDFDHTFNQMMSQLRRRLIENARENVKRTASPSREVDNEEDAEEEDKEKEREEKGLVKAYDEFQSRMEDLTRSLSPGQRRSAALCMWFEVSLLILIDRLKKLEDAEPFVRHWLTHAARGQTIQNSQEALSYQVFAAISTLATLERAHPQTNQTRGRLARLHELANRFSERDTELSTFDSYEVFDEESPPLITNLVSLHNTETDLRTATESMLAIPTTDQQLARLRKAIDSDQPVPDDLPLWEIPAGSALKTVAESGYTLQIKPLNGATSCPHCFMGLIRSAHMDLEKHRFTQCSNCQKFITDSN